MNKSNISIVDDDREILEIIEYEFINEHEYSIKFFQDGNVFTSDISESLDLAIIDVCMPDFDIVQAVRKIDDIAPMAYVIIMSAEKDFSQLVSLTNMGIFRYLEKDGVNFLPTLREYVQSAHRKIRIRKGLLDGN